MGGEREAEGVECVGAGEVLAGGEGRDGGAQGYDAAVEP